MSLVFLPYCVSEATAHLTESYPYSFKLRCQRKEWLEFRPNHGFRLTTMTQNPKRPGLVWNKPKYSTYADLAVLFLDEEEHVQWATLNAWSTVAQVGAFEAQYLGGLASPEHKQAFKAIYRQAHITDERQKIQVRLQAMHGLKLEGSGARIIRQGQYVCGVYTFWTQFGERAYIFPDASTAQALIDTFPQALGGATVLAASA